MVALSIQANLLRRDCLSNLSIRVNLHPMDSPLSLKVPLIFLKVNLRSYIVHPKALLTSLKVNPKWYIVLLKALCIFCQVKLKCCIMHLKALLSFCNRIHTLIRQDLSVKLIINILVLNLCMGRVFRLINPYG